MVTPDRGAGVVLGIACGDALGRPVEGWPADELQDLGERLATESFTDPPGQR